VATIPLCLLKEVVPSDPIPESTLQDAKDPIDRNIRQLKAIANATIK
jgi:hypothetical protein